MSIDLKSRKPWRGYFETIQGYEREGVREGKPGWGRGGEQKLKRKNRNKNIKREKRAEIEKIVIRN